MDGGEAKQTTSSGAGDVRLGSALKRAREDAGLSLSQLASATYVSRGWINNVEHGRRWPSRLWVQKVEEETKATGKLVPDWDRAQSAKETSEKVSSLLTRSLKGSRLALLSAPRAAGIDEIQQSVANLAVDYLSSPPQPMLDQAAIIQNDLHRRLAQGSIHKSEKADAYVALSRVSGILAYSALDLGYPKVAATHAHIAFRMASRAQDSTMQAWSRGTQSLIARFRKDFSSAEWFIADGMKFAGAGTSEVRLLCGAAQCAANLGDTESVLTFLQAAESAREQIKSADEVEGLFGFSPAKQSYYSASSLMWLPDPRALKISVKSAEEAIDIWSREPVAQRSLDDESLAHVYMATARLQLGEIDGALDAVRPILDLPPERQISWIQKRIGELSDILEHDPRYRGSMVAASARDQLDGYAAS